MDIWLKTKRRINNRLIGEIPAICSKIPIDKIFSILDDHHVTPINEDGSYWSGILCGESGMVHIDVIFQEFMVNSVLRISWYKFETGRYEISTYLS